MPHHRPGTREEKLPLLARDLRVALSRSELSGEAGAKLNARRHARSTGGASDADVGSVSPRSPFDTGFPMVFPTSPVPSPRPHRLSFSYSAKHDRHRELHVFLTLLMSVVGAGMLAVPYTFLLVPVPAALAGLALVGAAMAVTSIALLRAHTALAAEEERVLHIGAGRRFSSFQSLAIVAGGEALGYVVSVVTAVGIYGGCVGCIRIVKDLAPFMVAVVARVAAADLSATAGQRWADWLLGATFAVVVLPLCLLRNLSGLRVSSYVGFVCSLGLVGAIVYRALAGTHEELSLPSPSLQSSPPPLVLVPTPVVGSAFSRLSQAVSIYNYAFMMQLNLIPLFIQLRGGFSEPLAVSSAKMTRAVVGVSATCVALYAALGFFAHRLYGPAVRGNVLLNLERDAVMAGPLVAVFGAVVLTFPLLFHPLRGVLEELVCGHGRAPGGPTRLGATATLLLSQLLLAVGVPGVEVVFALTGASSCLLICFVLPAGLYWKLAPWRREPGLVLALGLIVGAFTALGAHATWFLLVDSFRRRH